MHTILRTPVTACFHTGFWGTINPMRKIGFLRQSVSSCLVVLASVIGTVAADDPIGAGNWPAWRRDGTGVSDEKNLPVEWSETANVALRLAQMNAVDPIGERDTKTGLCEVRCPHCALPHKEWCVLGIAIKCAEALRLRAALSEGDSK